LGSIVAIVCGDKISVYALIGAGTVVTKDIPDHSLVVGNPAKQIRWMRGGKRLSDNLNCVACETKI
jgi:UDP-2-acetamido-3-amino-2,3-dideoxy-glucuronate N-acetyltransferase